MKEVSVVFLCACFESEVSVSKGEKVAVVPFETESGRRVGVAGACLLVWREFQPLPPELNSRGGSEWHVRQRQKGSLRVWKSAPVLFSPGSPVFQFRFARLRPSHEYRRERGGASASQPCLGGLRKEGHGDLTVSEDSSGPLGGFSTDFELEDFGAVPRCLKIPNDSDVACVWAGFRWGQEGGGLVTYVNDGAERGWTSGGGEGKRRRLTLIQTPRHFPDELFRDLLRKSEAEKPSHPLCLTVSSPFPNGMRGFEGRKRSMDLTSRSSEGAKESSTSRSNDGGLIGDSPAKGCTEQEEEGEIAVATFRRGGGQSESRFQPQAQPYSSEIRRVSSPSLSGRRSGCFFPSKNPDGVSGARLCRLRLPLPGAEPLRACGAAPCVLSKSRKICKAVPNSSVTGERSEVVAPASAPPCRCVASGGNFRAVQESFLFRSAVDLGDASGDPSPVPLKRGSAFSSVGGKGGSDGVVEEEAERELKTSLAGQKQGQSVSVWKQEREKERGRTRPKEPIISMADSNRTENPKGFLQSQELNSPPSLPSFHFPSPCTSDARTPFDGERRVAPSSHPHVRQFPFPPMENTRRMLRLKSKPDDGMSSEVESVSAIETESEALSFKSFVELSEGSVGGSLASSPRYGLETPDLSSLHTHSGIQEGKKRRLLGKEAERPLRGLPSSPRDPSCQTLLSSLNEQTVCPTESSRGEQQKEDSSTHSPTGRQREPQSIALDVEERPTSPVPPPPVFFFEQNTDKDVQQKSSKRALSSRDASPAENNRHTPHAAQEELFRANDRRGSPFHFLSQSFPASGRRSELPTGRHFLPTVIQPLSQSNHSVTETVWRGEKKRDRGTRGEGPESESQSSEEDVEEMGKQEEKEEEERPKGGGK
uniref:Uncharacterized protein n=1 Tax=Chromera velia CCMP2878 TaxID=1169474 RepID=A0A0G4HUV4_9ALVE|eukprot:Cvel_8676.t1-p1 / transcript=Cvel_8676.t1 / gene=Cvel_8676 / organism=Chromera_velia_CCMP2878 / gene_product=hypothetical protein / transcript_product=hypothetical protein / location=Cvel_scaffold484:27557-30184(+) / protein_length=876 / sequence_SO=supercontig / SO=protein_coding / is_pseudo=false